MRHAIAHEAARLMYERIETEYFTAKRKAAKRLCRDRFKPQDLPSNAEIRDAIQTFARLFEGDRRADNLRDMRLQALQTMRLLRRYRPRLIGSVMTGHVRKGSDIDIHVFADSAQSIAEILEGEALQYDIERKEITKHGESRVFTHVHVYDRFNLELTVYAEDKAHYVFRSSITGKPIERASIRELEELLLREYPGIDLEANLESLESRIDPFQLFHMLLSPLENVKQSRVHHPEGDVLYHSLQVFELARDERPYDEEFLLAALLHDIGKGIDSSDHVNAGLDALDGLITDRTRFLIAHHMDAHDIQTGGIGSKLRQRLQASPDYEDLMLLRSCDDRGRVPGAPVGTLDEAFDYLRELQRQNG